MGRLFSLRDIKMTLVFLAYTNQSIIDDLSNRPYDAFIDLIERLKMLRLDRGIREEDKLRIAGVIEHYMDITRYNYEVQGYAI